MNEGDGWMDGSQSQHPLIAPQALLTAQAADENGIKQAMGTNESHKSRSKNGFSVEVKNLYCKIGGMAENRFKL